MNASEWPFDNITVAALSLVGGAASAMLAARVKRSIARDNNLIKGYDNFTNRLSARVTELEKQLSQREAEYYIRLNELETRLRTVEESRSAQRVRIEELERRLSDRDIRDID